VIWFPSRQLGLANGLVTLGMALGFFIGSMVSATYLSPTLGGWRNVFLFYGVIAILFMLPWSLTHSSPKILQSVHVGSSPASFKESMSHLMKIKEMWLLGFAFLGVSGGILGLLGYLPLYLQDLGWTVSNTGGVMAAFNIASMAFVLPLTLWSDRLGSRSIILLGAALLITIGIGLLAFVGGTAIWVLVILVGTVRDSFMGILFTKVIETRGVGRTYSSLAIAFAMVFIGVGNLIGPPLGNALANETMPGAPLLFWATLTFMGAVCIFLASRQETALVKAEPEIIEKL
jgi:predicted MFS family arabinose efflux permease